MNTNTPRTDAIISAIDMDAAFQDLCRQLERELAHSLANQVKAQAEVERLKDGIRGIEVALKSAQTDNHALLEEIKMIKKELADWDYETRVKREQQAKQKAEAEAAAYKKLATEICKELMYKCNDPLHKDQLEELTKNPLKEKDTIISSKTPHYHHESYCRTCGSTDAKVGNVSNS